METTTQSKAVCFAYFGDGKFLGWYSDTFGSLTPNRPKVYTYSDKQVEIVAKNFRYKLSKLNEESKLHTIKPSLAALKPLDDGLNEDKTALSQYKEVELRVVECPEYDGPNPNFDRPAYEKLRDERHAKLEAFLTEKGVGPGFSLERVEAVKEFENTNPRVACDNWVYADRTKVNEWALNEPTSFLETLKP